MAEAVVIGGSSGIGKTAVKALCAAGYNVTNISRTACEADGVNNIEADVSKEGELENALLSLPVPDVAVYSAGFSLAAPTEYVLQEDFRYLFEVNFFGFVRTVRSLVTGMRNNGGGRIIAVSSLGSVIPIIFDSFYSASKAALDMFIRGANVEMNPYNIYLTSVRPGATQTRFTFKRKVYPEEDVGVYGDKLHKATVTLADMEQRGMDPSDVADCIMKVIAAKKPPMSRNVGFTNKSLSLAEKLLPEAFTAFLNKNLYLQ